VGPAPAGQRGDRHRSTRADVLDVDVRPDGDGFAAFNRLRRAGLLTGARALVRTRSGGLHVYYAGTAQPSGRLVRHFLDLKAVSGYVIAPPSFVDADETGPAGAVMVCSTAP
jgi:Bifunctional DNA primase/polymerase, N-terminal